MWLYGWKSLINVEGDLFLKCLIKEFMFCYYFFYWVIFRNNVIMLILWLWVYRILNMVMNMVVIVCCFCIFYFCCLFIVDGICCILRKSCVLFYYRCGLSYLVLGRSGFFVFVRYSVGSFFILWENRFLMIGFGFDNIL